MITIRRNALRKLGAAAAVAGLMVAGALATAPSALAARTPPPGYGLYANCPGNELPSTDLGSGRLRLWYSTLNGGTLCAKVYDDLPGSHNMYVSINRTDWKTIYSDDGYYTTYAGGVAVFGINGKCANVNGTLEVGAYTAAKSRFTCA
ncbi:hypothetical protein [Amycolatopsis sp. H20-H5]|uniref:hypothetical protein n=1 Tax=Amycolatopsis sp. H20-H5 TaxID=3046309 RepID=UPI002DBCC382|nr:hypothetical protein [Amycolatopsis sp. H20-H5]MEC3977518.1 hypothetical protein [Amycolatopsis sp. H20-H5]